MTDLNDKVTIIIRSVSERTEQLCRELIVAQGVNPANVDIVREAPFSAAMRTSFEIGIDRSLPWTFCVDADLLLRPGAVKTMVELAEAHEDRVCEVQGFILDKFFGGPKAGGVHLYRTSLLPLALINIPTEGVNIRPEAHMLEILAAQGYPYRTVRYLVGLHDFEQFYRDIFRKCFVHAHKFSQYTELLLSIWREGAPIDIDYQVALQGFASGVAYSGQTLIDTRQPIYQQRFAELQVEEKSPLSSASLSLDAVERIIANWVEPGAYHKQFPTKMGLAPPEELTMKERLAEHLGVLGPVRMVPYTAGWAFKLLGKALQGWASS